MIKSDVKSKLLRKEIDDFINLLQKHKVQISEVILFGSHAKKKAHKYSDIDLAIISPQFGQNEIEEMMMLSKLSWKVSDRIEAIPIEKKRFLRSQYHPLIGEIKKYGRVIYSA